MTNNTESNESKNSFLDKLEESENQIKKFSWTPYALILLCFSLPFLEVSCQGQKIASLTGFQTAFGTQMSKPNAFGPTQTQDIPGTPILILVLLIALVCIALPFLKLKINHLIASIGSGLSLLLLIFTKLNLDNESLKQGGGILVIQVAYGYILIFCLFILGGLTHGFLHNQKKKKTPADVPTELASNSSGLLFNSNPPTEFDIGRWINKNKTPVIIGTSALAGLFIISLFFYGSFWFFFSHTPEGDAKSASANYCNCQENRNSKLIDLKREFLKSFDSYKFKTQEDAQQKLQKLMNSAEKEFSICNNQAKAGYTELKNSYLQNKVELERFEKLFEAQNDTCSPTNELKLSEITDEVDEKISNIEIIENSFNIQNSFAAPSQPTQTPEDTNTQENNQPSERNQLLNCQNGQTGFFTGGNFRSSPQHSQNTQNIIAIVDPNAEVRVLSSITGEARQSTGNTTWYKVRFLNGVCHFDSRQTTDVDSCAIQNLSVGFVNADLVLGCR